MDMQSTLRTSGAADLASDLKKSCHVALYGVLFDFNKSTLQPASAPVLQKVAGLLAKDATLKLEVQAIPTMSAPMPTIRRFPRRGRGP